MKLAVRGAMFAGLVLLGATLATACRTGAGGKGEARAAEPGMHRVVIEMSGDGPERWEGVLNNVDNLQKAFGADRTKIEVVAHGRGLGLLLGTNEALKARMQGEHDAGVVFAACQNSMRKFNVTKEQLLPFATTVDSGVAEVVRKQEEGWSYLKGGS